MTYNHYSILALTLSLLISCSACTQTAFRQNENNIAIPSRESSTIDLSGELTTEQISNIPLPIPGNLQAYRAGSSVTFSWTHPWRGGPQNSPIFSHYNVYRSIDGGPLALIGTTTANRFSDSLEASGNASYAVSVVTVAGEEGAISKSVKLR